MIKSFLSIGLLLLVLLPGCSKSHSPQPGLTGRWRFDDAVSVDPGWVIDYAPGGVLELRPDSTFTFTQPAPGGMVGTGTYSTTVSNTGGVSHSFLYMKATDSSTVSAYEMRLNGLKLTLTGKYAIDYYHKL
ncbi:MAG TPA: hypothetical protein VIM64_04835 [Puia sp.]